MISETRSFNMGQIKSKNTKPEMLVRRFLHANGFRYTLHAKYLPGKPDIVLPKSKAIILVHGCFWHSHEIVNLIDHLSQILIFGTLNFSKTKKEILFKDNNIQN